MKPDKSKRTMSALGETHLRAAGPQVMATPNANVGFWIITIMLVLFGLSTLKIR
jgi:UDP-N-acetylmuramyl pentapeptide phosphotransferase/UDP-N-acetylglucosamine-1-phosphate transferase